MFYFFYKYLYWSLMSWFAPCRIYMILSSSLLTCTRYVWLYPNFWTLSNLLVCCSLAECGCHWKWFMCILFARLILEVFSFCYPLASSGFTVSIKSISTSWCIILYIFSLFILTLDTFLAYLFDDVGTWSLYLLLNEKKTDWGNMLLV